jgi:hypothetical protein
MIQGEYGDKYYIILDGEIEVYIAAQSTQELDIYDLSKLVIENFD